MNLCSCAWRLTLAVSSMGAWGATAGNVKRLLPPRQSRGISFVSLEDFRLYAILNSLNSAAHSPAVGTNLCALTEVPLVLQLCAQLRLRRYFPPQSVDFLLTGHPPSPSSSFGIMPCPCPRKGSPGSIVRLESLRCSTISLA